MKGLVFGRRSPGGHGGATANSDCLFSRVADKVNREALTVRIHADVMRKLRWMVGDYVVLRPDEDFEKWSLERVNGPKQGGIKLTTASGKSSAHGRASFTIEGDVLDLIFGKENRSFTATLCDQTGNEAVFVRE